MPADGEDGESGLGYVLDAICFVYTFQRLKDLTMIAGTAWPRRSVWRLWVSGPTMRFQSFRKSSPHFRPTLGLFFTEELETRGRA